MLSCHHSHVSILYHLYSSHFSSLSLVRTFIRLQKTITLRLLAHDASSHHDTLLAANLAIESAQTHDVTHCPFYCLLLHAVGQIHLAHGESDAYIAVELDLLEKIAAKWYVICMLYDGIMMMISCEDVQKNKYLVIFIMMY